MFLDASVIIAIIGDEEDAEALIDKIEAAAPPVFYSPLVAYEAIVGFARKKVVGRRRDSPIPLAIVEQAEDLVGSFLAQIGAIEMPITSEVGRGAVSAYKTYGKGLGHRARLNFGDCFAYACARSLNAPLLFKGNDFPHTDIVSA
jgi:ribonuclease VapC